MLFRDDVFFALAGGCSVSVVRRDLFTNFHKPSGRYQLENEARVEELGRLTVIERNKSQRDVLESPFRLAGVTWQVCRPAELSESGKTPDFGAILYDAPKRMHP